MTVGEYNEWYKKLNNAMSFVFCINHALQKSDYNAKMQFSVIGWSDETKQFLEDAIECYAKRKKEEVENMPFVDAVEVVRCKNCADYEVAEYDDGCTKNVCRLFNRQMQENDYCSYGKRK